MIGRGGERAFEEDRGLREIGRTTRALRGIQERCHAGLRFGTD